MQTKCEDLKIALAICLQRSPCVLIHRNTPKECINNTELRKQLPEECLLRYTSYLECRKRIRGNGPVDTGKYDQEYERISSGKINPEEEIKKIL